MIDLSSRSCFSRLVNGEKRKIRMDVVAAEVFGAVLVLALNVLLRSSQCDNISYQPKSVNIEVVQIDLAAYIGKHHRYINPVDD